MEIVFANGGKRFTQAGLAGRFRVAMPEGRYTVHAKFSSWSDDSPQAAMVFDPVEVEAGGPAITIRARIGETIEGRVLGPAGAKLGGLRVEAALPATGDRGPRRVRTTTTDAEGRFVLYGLQGGPFELSVIGKDLPLLFDPAHGVALGDKDVKLLGHRGFEIRGRVIFDGKPPPKVRATLYAKHGVRRRVTIAKDGTFHIQGLREGPHDLHLRAGTHNVRRTLEAGDGNVEIRLD